MGYDVDVSILVVIHPFRFMTNRTDSQHGQFFKSHWCVGHAATALINLLRLFTYKGYGSFGGTKTTAEELTKIFDFMDIAGVLTPDRLLTGYIPNAASLDTLHQLVRKLKARNPDLIYLLDRKDIQSSTRLSLVEDD